MTFTESTGVLTPNPDGGLRPKLFRYQRHLIRTLRARTPFVVSLLLLEMRAELAVRRKLFPKAKA
jgi:hypothetical protein